MSARQAWGLALALALASAWAPAQETQIAGVAVPAISQLGGDRLVLNGAGTRRYFGFKVYVAALYLPAATRDPGAVLGRDAKRRLRLTLLREVSAEQHVDALFDGLVANNSAEELAALQAEIDHCRRLLRQTGELPAGTEIHLDYLPGAGTRIAVAGRELGNIPGERFNRALMRIWLGDDPIEESLKRALLGIERQAHNLARPQFDSA